MRPRSRIDQNAFILDLNRDDAANESDPAVALSKVCTAAAAESAMDVEKAGYAKEQQNGVVCAHEGVGDPFTYRGRTGAFTAYEWAVQIVLPILVVLLGALPLEASIACRPHLEEPEFGCCLDWSRTVNMCGCAVVPCATSIGRLVREQCISCLAG